MEFISLFTVSMAGLIISIVLNPPDIDIDCSKKKLYNQMLEYCTTGTVPPNFPKDLKGRKCGQGVISRLEIQVNTCK